jgi:hypothetical protein
MGAPLMGDCQYAVKAAILVYTILIASRIVLPKTINDKPVFVGPGEEVHDSRPDAFSVFLHGGCLRIPPVETSGQKYRLGLWVMISETDPSFFNPLIHKSPHMGSFPGRFPNRRSLFCSFVSRTLSPYPANHFSGGFSRRRLQNLPGYKPYGPAGVFITKTIVTGGKLPA